MLPAMLLALREGVEIALIVGILFSAVHQLKRPDLTRTLRLGVISAILFSLGVAVLLNLLGASLEGEAEAIYEGAMMWSAAAMLTWMFLWMQSHAIRMKSMLREELGLASRMGKASIFLVAFVAVLREGIEFGLFLTASVFTSSLPQTLLGATLGVVLAILLGWGLFRATFKLDLHLFFRLTSIFLVLFAAGLVAHGMHEFNEVGLISGIIPHLWNTNSFISETSFLGQVMTTLFGYSSDPSLTEAISYGLYFVVLYIATRPPRGRLAARQGVAS